MMKKIEYYWKLWLEGWKNKTVAPIMAITAGLVLAAIYFLKIKLWKPKSSGTRRRRRYRPRVIVRNYRRR